MKIKITAILLAATLTSELYGKTRRKSHLDKKCAITELSENSVAVAQTITYQNQFTECLAKAHLTCAPKKKVSFTWGDYPSRDIICEKKINIEEKLQWE